MRKLFSLIMIGMIATRAFAQKTSVYNRPQTPHPPFPYQSIEVVYDNKTDTSVRLAGTLTIPEGSGPFPAVLIIGGSGQFPRDEPYFDHKPPLVLADYLTRRGIATLRFDDRGAGRSTPGKKPLRELTGTELISDARAGIEFLQSRSEIDKRKIGVLGGSAGASQAVSLAVASPAEIAFVVHIVGTTNLTPGEIVALQSKTVARVKKLSPIAQQADSNFVRRSLWFTKNETDINKREESITQIAIEELAAVPKPERDSIEKGFRSRVKILSSELFYKGANNPARDMMKEVQCPVLVINGDKDVLVDGPYNVEHLEASLRSGDNKDYEVHLIKGMNHRMQLATTGLMEESKDIEETVMPQVLKLIGDWIVRHVY